MCTKFQKLKFKRAAGGGVTAHDHGWQEDWNWVTSQVTGAQGRLLQPEPAECHGARYYELTRINTSQKRRP